jgi:Tfp pilus assembly protein FimV
MPSGKFRCSKCDRTFSMAAHLARHQNSMHGSRPAGRGPGRRSAGAAPKGRRVAMSAFAGAGASHLITQMQAYCQSLTVQRDELESQIAQMETAMQALDGGFPGGGRRGPVRAAMKSPAARASGGAKRGRPAGGGMRAGSLKDWIIKILRQRGKAMSPREIASSVMSSGYKTKSKDLTKAVSNALPELRQLRKVGRGLYQA